MEKDLTKGSVIKTLLLFVTPIIGANLLQAMYGTVDLMVVGLFSKAAEVSAVSTGSMTMQTVTGIITGLTMGCTILLGQNIGKKDYKASAKTIASAFILFCVFAILLTVFIVLNALMIAQLMNAPSEALVSTTQYLRICGLGVISIVLFNAISGIFRGIGDSKTPLVLMMIACISNIIGDVIFVGVCHAGAKGAALATIMAQTIAVIGAALLIQLKGFGFEYDRSSLKPAKAETLKILQFGLPIAGQEALTGISFMVILALLNQFGVIASAGVGVAEKICALIFIVPSGTMAALSAFTAQNVGAKQIERTKQGLKISIIFCEVIGILMFLLVFTKGVWLSSFFTRDIEIAKAAADYLRSYGIDCMLVAFNFSLMGYLNGYGKTGFVALQGILSTFLVRIPVCYFMSKIPAVSLFQVGFATPLATLFAIIITVIYILYLRKYQKL